MLSRVADSIYWMARNTERAENLARLLLANQNLRLDSGSKAQDEREFWKPILMTTGDEEGYEALFPEVRGEDVEEYLSVRPENPNSIMNCIRSARENARMVRDQITDEMWRSVNDLYLFLTSARAAQMRVDEPTEFYEQVIQGSCLFQGVVRTTMLRDEGWQFFQIGTYLERADKTSRLVDMCSGVPLVMPPHPDAQPLRWLSLLHSCSAYHGYREAHNQLDPRSVLSFLFLSPTFARSVRFSVREVDRALNKLQAPPGPHDTPDPVRASGRLRADLDYGTLDEILATGIHEYIDRLQTRLNAIGLAIFETFVLYADLAPTNPEAVPDAIVTAGAWKGAAGVPVLQAQ
jgi:uncharacterized alpha-E superfamily protein